MKLTREPLPSSFTITGATGKSSAQVKGTFEPTNEVQNSLPVYKKKGDTSLWIEAVKGASGWRWYLKPTANKGPESSVCFAYLNFNVGNVGLPQEVNSEWFVSCAEGFVGQKLLVESVGGDSFALKQMIDAFGEKLKEEDRLLKADVNIFIYTWSYYCIMLIMLIFLFF